MRRWQRWGVKPGRKPKVRCSIRRLQARGRPEGRTNVNLRKPRYPELREMEAPPENWTRRWEAAVVAEVSMSATRAPRSRGIGGARHRPHLTSAEHGNPVTVRWRRPFTGRPTARRADIRGGTGRPRSKRRQPKATGKPGQDDRTLHRRSFSDNWPHTRPGAWARKGADVSRVTL